MSDRKRPDIIKHTIGSDGKPFVRDIDIRGNQVDTSDITKPFSLSLQDIDTAIIEHIKQNILPVVYTDSSTIVPPVIYANPEIWQSIQKEGVYRDTNKKVIYPLIVISRDSIEPLRNTTNKLDANTPHNVYSYETTWSKKNQYSLIEALDNREPVKEYRTIVIPDYIKLNYTCYVFSDYMEHHNGIISLLKYASDSFWGVNDKKYKTNIDSIPTTIENTTDSGGRIITSQFNLTVFGHILPDAVIRHANSVQKAYSKAVVNIKVSENK